MRLLFSFEIDVNKNLTKEEIEFLKKMLFNRIIGYSCYDSSIPDNIKNGNQKIKNFDCKVDI